MAPNKATVQRAKGESAEEKGGACLAQLGDWGSMVVLTSPGVMVSMSVQTFDIGLHAV